MVQSAASSLAVGSQREERLQNLDSRLIKLEVSVFSASVSSSVRKTCENEPCNDVCMYACIRACIRVHARVWIAFQRLAKLFGLKVQAMHWRKVAGGGAHGVVLVCLVKPCLPDFV